MLKKKKAEPTLTEIAERINTHLARIEANPKLNNFKPGVGGDLFKSHARRGGRFVRVKYKSYWTTSSLARVEALAYLAWLDAGNVGMHYEQQRVSKTSRGGA
mgnify:CR=1 FL=1